MSLPLIINGMAHLSRTCCTTKSWYFNLSARKKHLYACRLPSKELW